MAQYERARAIYPAAAWTLETMGYSYWGRQMLEEALDSFSLALSYDPTRTGAYTAMANIYKSWSNPVDTAAHFALLSDQQPDVPTYAGLAAHIYTSLDEVAEATEHYEKLLAFAPHYADAHYNLALLYERGSDGRVAMRHWNTYLALAAGSQYAPEAEARREALRRVVIAAPTDDEQVGGQVAIEGSALIDDF
jgi:tetratricopeptide (TPR) repeat protein